MSDIVIKVENVKKDFYLPHEKGSNSLKGKLVNIFKRRSREIDTQHALRGVSFEIKKGEFFGIVGRNGSGKSTLLKMLAGIYQPTEGTIETHGKIVPFIELGVGFNPELSGRENVYLNGALLGFSRGEIDAIYDEIVDFAELHDFMEQKLKNYSSGMQVRLAFSVATHARADIMIVDEVLAVGDAAFQRKCYEYFRNIKKDKNITVVFVTHDMNAVKTYCDSAILIDGGLITCSGNPETVSDEYLKLFVGSTDTVINEPNRWGSGEVIFKDIKHKIGKDIIKIEFDLVNQTDKMLEDDLNIAIDFYHRNRLLTGIDSKLSDNLRSGFSLKKRQSKHIAIEMRNNLGRAIYITEMRLETGNGTICDKIKNAFLVENTSSSNHIYPITSDVKIKEEK